MHTRKQPRNPEVPVIRAMTVGDLAGVQPLMGQLGYAVQPGELRRRFDTTARTRGHRLYVAERGRKIVGFIHVFARPALEKPVEAIVQSMVVDTTLRRGGIGRALMAAAENWARGEGLASVALGSQVDRDDAHAFYESLGYERVATSGLFRKKL